MYQQEVGLTYACLKCLWGLSMSVMGAQLARAGEGALPLCRDDVGVVDRCQTLSREEQSG